MNKRNMKVLLFFIFFLFVSFITITQAQSNGTVSKDGSFRLSAYDTFISFSDNITAIKIKVFTDNITFYDVQMGAGPIINTTFSVINANMTITNLFTDQRLTMTIDAPSGNTSQTKVYWPYDSTPTATCTVTPSYWNFDGTSKIATLNVTHPSVVECSLFVPAPPTPTTVPSGDGGGPGPTKLPIEEPKLTYSMPASLELYENETEDFTIKVTNPGTKALYNITIDILGIPKTSYSLIPSLVDSLETNKSTYFTVSINTQDIASGSYTLTFNITSKETFEETTMTLKVEEKPTVTTTTVTTTTIPPEEEEKIEVGVNIVKILIIVAVIIAVAMAFVYIRLKRARTKSINK